MMYKQEFLMFKYKIFFFLQNFVHIHNRKQYCNYSFKLYYILLDLILPEINKIYNLRCKICLSHKRLFAIEFM